jgi:DNA-directed RNA polymerase specialized sigma24 family protein
MEMVAMTEVLTASVKDLYSELAPTLERIVLGNVQASPGLMEEACQAAWAELIACRDQLMPGTELCWLATAATREALLLIRAQRRDLSLEEECRQGGEVIELAVTRTPDSVVELRERLAEVRQLPQRQHRMVMLHGFGYEYREIAAVTGDSRRTVERQLHYARRRLAS